MIPLHRPYFGVGTVIGATLFPPVAAKDSRRYEEAHATAAGCAEAVWLPSARAGIAWALRAAITPDTKVIGPAFTCSVVHEAMIRSGGYPQIVDASPHSFEMEASALRAAQNDEYALVLSEPYGHAYDLDALDNAAPAKAQIRIVDSAMAMPRPALFARLRGNDFAVVSFGSGKTVYSGWGAMGFTNDAALAREVRKIRATMLSASSSKLTLKRSLNISLRTAAQHPLIFSATRKLWYQVNALRSWRNAKSAPPSAPVATRSFAFPAAWSDDKTCGAEWRLPSTRVDRALALRNLKTSEAVHARRMELAQRYHDNLTGATRLVLPPVSRHALSHYSVRVEAGIRNRLKEELYRRGIYTISLWTFSEHLDPQEFPNASRICAEVINLPLSPWMRAEQVDEVCEQLLNSLRLLA